MNPFEMMNLCSKFHVVVRKTQHTSPDKCPQTPLQITINHSRLGHLTTNLNINPKNLVTGLIRDILRLEKLSSHPKEG